MRFAMGFLWAASLAIASVIAFIVGFIYGDAE